MPAKSNFSSKIVKPALDPAWVGFWAEVRRLDALDKERQAEAQGPAVSKKSLSRIQEDDP